MTPFRAQTRESRIKALLNAAKLAAARAAAVKVAPPAAVASL